MKQPIAYGKGKAHQIRKTRRCAAMIKGRSKVYRRIDKWEESGAGTPDYQITITLHSGWSFDEDTPVSKKVFSSVADAMRGISMTYVAPEEHVQDQAQEQPASGSDNWQERLAELTSITAD